MRAPTTTELAQAPNAARGGHIVDAVDGPLVGTGRVRRIAPFAATAAVSLTIAVPATTWTRPMLATIGVGVIAATIAVAALVPWQRCPKGAQLAAPALFLMGIVVLANATDDGVSSPFITLAVVPLMWLAIYENRWAVMIAAVVAGAGLWLGGPDEPSPQGPTATVATAVFIVVCVGMGLTLHGLVAEARTSARRLREQRLALEQNAAVLDALPERVSRYRLADRVITYCNPAWAMQYHVDRDSAVGRVLDDFLSPDEVAGLHQQLALINPRNPIVEDTVARATGAPNRQWLEWVDRYIETEHGPEILSIGRDVTRRRNAEVDLAATEAGFRDLADRSADVVWRFSLLPQPHFDYMSPSVQNLSGYPAAFFLDDFSRLINIVDEESATALTKALIGDQLEERFDIRFRHANGEMKVIETRTSVIRGGLQGVSRDVTELRQLQEEMAALALRDPLTGLANRRLFDELLAADLSRTQRDERSLAVAFLDLDGLKHVNDVYGHDAGDVVLRETASRLRSVLRGADKIARLGGDEFAVIYSPGDSSSFNLIPRIDHALAEPIAIDAETFVTCPASIGVADTSTVGYSSEALIAAADEAMYENKRARHALRDAALAHS